jgi:hypothetical protein
MNSISRLAAAHAAARSLVASGRIPGVVVALAVGNQQPDICAVGSDADGRPLTLLTISFRLPQSPNLRPRSPFCVWLIADRLRSTIRLTGFSIGKRRILALPSVVCFATLPDFQST